MKISLANIDVELGRGSEMRGILNDVSLDLAAGEQIAIIGPSGAGKTTLLHTLACAIAPSRGMLLIDGASPWKLSKASLHRLRGNIFLAPQAPPLPPRQRVVHTVLAGRLAKTSMLAALASLYKPRDAAVAEAYAALAQFRVEDKLWLRCDRLSGGERQRVGLARMLVSDTPLILLDEPVSALDPALGLSALKTIQDEATARHATLVVSLHDVQLARQRFSRLVGLKAGRIHFDLPASAVDESTLADLYGAEFEEASGVAQSRVAVIADHEIASETAMAMAIAKPPPAERCF